MPKKLIYRGRRAGLGWITGQLVWEGDQMFIVNHDTFAGWCFFAVDEVEEITQ